MGLLRAFIASELPAWLQDSVQAAIAELRESIGPDLVRWVPGRNIHLTLKFLGDVSPASLALVENLLVTEAARYQPFDVMVEGFGAYPNARRPRILWVGLKPPADLASLQHDLEMGTARLGYESEEREFSPHLTVGRVRQTASSAELQKIRTEVEQTSIGQLGVLRVDAVHLFKSDLQPSGSIYTRLFSAELGKA